MAAFVLLESIKLLPTKDNAYSFKAILKECGALSTILGPDISVQEALETFLGDEGTNPVEEIFIAPPKPAVLADEDSKNDDEGGDFNN
ncbi:hypothetical protein ILUMI_25133 [Ignelater luminosus]|uniref:Uncharacterized protein n=1 Tax=Ignelater luminosus TaxID=2038154 RepID=A0A8K0C568_IGNLU|nr:hypothetical protein ILUMI_25133 [Ignelater luminosus]